MAIEMTKTTTIFDFGPAVAHEKLVRFLQEMQMASELSGSVRVDGTKVTIMYEDERRVDEG